MFKQWVLRQEVESLLISRRVSQWESSASLSSLRVTESDLDRWLANPLLRRTLLEIYADLFGGGLTTLRLAGLDSLHQYVKPRLLQAFQRRELMVVPASAQPRKTQPAKKSRAHSQRSEPIAAQVVTTTPQRSPHRPVPPPKDPKTWLEIKLLDPQRQPVAGAKYRVKLSTGETKEGILDEVGGAEFYDLPRGNCEVSFPELTPHSWRHDEGERRLVNSLVQVSTGRLHRFLLEEWDWEMGEFEIGEEIVVAPSFDADPEGTKSSPFYSDQEAPDWELISLKIAAEAVEPLPSFADNPPLLVTEEDTEEDWELVELQMAEEDALPNQILPLLAEESNQDWVLVELRIAGEALEQGLAKEMAGGING